MNIWEYFVRQGRKEYSANARLAAIACESLVFVLGIPVLLVWSAGVGSDRWRFKLVLPLWVICLVLAVLGLFLALWTVALAALIGFLPTAGLLNLSFYQLYGVAAFLGWVSGNVYVQRARRMPKPLRSRDLLI